MWKAILNCFGEAGQQEKAPIREKERIHEGDFSHKDAEASQQIILALQEAEKSRQEIQLNVARVVNANGWTESLAKAILTRLTAGLESGMQMKGPLQDAFYKAVAEAFEFAHGHPVYTTVVALGILAVLLPWVIEALGFWAGFGEAGPLEGSFAAWWQSRYMGYVPKKSLFSFFQRLGMTWKSGAAVSGGSSYGAYRAVSKL